MKSKLKKFKFFAICESIVSMCIFSKNFELIDVEENCKIYHAAHSATNPVKWAEIHKIAKPIGEDLPVNEFLLIK